MKTVAVVPCYNEQNVISSVVEQLLLYVSTVIVVDDGSSDLTALSAKNAGATVIQHMINCGAGAATMTGIHAARLLHPDIIIILDGDGQHSPADIPQLIECQRNTEADIVFTNRFGIKNTIPYIRKVYNFIGNMLTFFATGMYVPDSQSGFKLLAKRAIAEIDLQMSGYEFCTEMVYEAKVHRWKIAHCPISVAYSKYTLAKGQSFSSGIKTALRILLHSLIR
jgi:glycosyltransferase involved in cell wall biosynthesis